jgi:protein TonB
MTSMAGMASRVPGAPPRTPASRTPADPGDDLFANVLVTSSRRPLTRWHKIGIGVALGLHGLGLLFAVYVMFFAPELLPERPDVLISLIYNPPPPPPPPLPKGSALRPQQAKPEAPKPVVENAKQFTAPIQTPQPDPKAEIQPEQGVKPQDQFGSETGSDLGDALGMEGGVEGGVVGGVPGGVLGGVIGGTGTGPVLDYDSPPKPVKITRPQYPQEAFVKKIEGTVLVEIMIDSSGRVVRARILQSVPMLDAAAIQTVYQWVFQPAVKRGRPVATIAQAPVSFRIY